MVRPGGRLESESPRRAGLGAFRFGVGHASEGRALSIDIDPNGFPATKKSSAHFSQSTPTVFHSSFIPFDIICPYIPTKTPSVRFSIDPPTPCVCVHPAHIRFRTQNQYTVALPPYKLTTPADPSYCVCTQHAGRRRPPTYTLHAYTVQKRRGGVVSCFLWGLLFCFSARPGSCAAPRPCVCCFCVE